MLFGQSKTPVRPLYIPFSVDSEYGLMDTLGNEFAEPGKYDLIYNKNDFRYYIIGDRIKDADYPKFTYWLMDPQTAKKIDLGDLIDDDPVMRIADTAWYHFHKDNKSILASPLSNKSFAFDQKYTEVSGTKLYDTLGKYPTQLFFAELEDYDKEVWKLVDNKLIKESKIKKSYTIETVGTYIDSSYYRRNFAIGIAVLTTKPVAETKQAPAVANGKLPPPVITPIDNDGNEDEFYANIYDKDLKLVGTTKTSEEELSKIFQKSAKVGNYLIASPSIGGGIIKQTGDDHSVDLNETYAIKRILKSRGNYGTQEYYFVRKEADNQVTEIATLVDTKPNWAYFGNQKLLSFFFYTDKRLSAYFDYNGVAMPKGKLMIPAKYYNEKQDPAFVPYLFK
ncbi:hypothetical protein C4F49_11130 [Sphingobacterium sp. KB22]|uniref:Uncharacterized protein n=2 Tax=Sphingobacterium hungaricum TaxID=2082723 RepID=A0A928YQH6_9SPHI|nr:hypothetical protein [Sphingobacterium hungaricum]